MQKRKKGAVRKEHGVMCNICGINCGKGGALKTHIEGAHKIDYNDYIACFYKKGRLIADSWDDSSKTRSGKIVVTHILVRRFFCEPSKRGVPRAARKRK